MHSLIELSGDLQETASYLEQIIPTLSLNILNAYSIGNLNNLDESDQLKRPNQLKIKKTKRKKTTVKKNQIDLFKHENNNWVISFFKIKKANLNFKKGRATFFFFF